jgi:hypothetical protein
MPYLSPRKSHARKARILPLRGRLGLRRSRETRTPQTCLRMRNTVDIRFAASEPATNKALQEVRVLGGFGLFSGFEDCKQGSQVCCSLFLPFQLPQGFSAWPILARWPLAKRFGLSTGGPAHPPANLAGRRRMRAWTTRCRNLATPVVARGFGKECRIVS